MRKVSWHWLGEVEEAIEYHFHILFLFHKLMVLHLQKNSATESSISIINIIQQTHIFNFSTCPPPFNAHFVIAIIVLGHNFIILPGQSKTCGDPPASAFWVLELKLGPIYWISSLTLVCFIWLSNATIRNLIYNKLSKICKVENGFIYLAWTLYGYLSITVKNIESIDYVTMEWM